MKLDRWKKAEVRQCGCDAPGGAMFPETEVELRLMMAE